MNVTVSEYVLPRFEVRMHADQQRVTAASSLSGTVEAVYTYVFIMCAT